MDVVRISVVGAIAACSSLMLLSTTRLGHAEPATVPTRPVAPPVDRTPGEAQPANPVVRVSPFSLSGPVLVPPQSTNPTIYGASLYPRPRFQGGAISQWDEMIEEAARRFNLPRSWVRGVIRMESGGQTMLNGRPITSLAGAMGLMQVMPETFAEMTRRYGLGSDPYEPRANILAGTAFLREMYDRYGTAHFLAAYNAGPGRVDDHLRSGRPLPDETQRYVRTLAPQLLGDTGEGAVSTPQVQDLTSADAMRRAALSPSRRTLRVAPRPEAAPLFVAANARLSSDFGQQDMQPNDALFIRLAHQDQRRVEPRNDSGDN
ncbi:lytic transglycosylase domain-containing protein [Lichenicoccus sp.]|uniref:lytic transglycosylase domain-containing protein n=1 Tax=Lichenicoccus sp. TaxID=2781899 RepID=UPI003D0F9B44